MSDDEELDGPLRKDKTTFPMNKIKQMMRCDDEVGRITKSSLITMSKATECFEKGWGCLCCFLFFLLFFLFFFFFLFFLSSRVCGCRNKGAEEEGQRKQNHARVDEGNGEKQRAV
jgi:hypothetical protein